MERRKGTPVPARPPSEERPIKEPISSPSTRHRVYENVPWNPWEILSSPERDPSSLWALIDRKATLGWSFIPWRVGRILEDDGKDPGSPSFAALFRALDAIRLPDPPETVDPAIPPFAGGHVVLVPFEWGELHEPSGGPFRHPRVPMVLAECTEVVAYHHKSRTLWLPPSCPYVPSETGSDGGPGPDSPFRCPVRLTPSLAFEAYQDRFAAVQEAIRSGRFFQLNLALSFEGTPDVPLDLIALYRALSGSNPGPGMGYFSRKGRTLVSNSPERLLTVQDGWITTSPIAGTRPAENPRPGESVAFTSDPKERSEHVMTVDILRNDLGRVSIPGTVEVPRFLAVESYAHLLHLVSDVRGRAVSGLTFRALLDAVFPGGSVTGAPKREVRKTIGELEGHPRDYYCGSLGFLSDTGVWDLNLLIRTLFVSPEGLNLPVGSGIVADSDPLREYEEIHTKARAFLERFGGEIRS